jgi:hypothetical protein
LFVILLRNFFTCLCVGLLPDFFTSLFVFVVIAVVRLVQCNSLQIRYL